MLKPIFIKLGMYITAPKHISKAYFINHMSVCLYVKPPIVARQRLGKDFTAPANIYGRIEELLAASVSMLSVLYERTVGY
jgi:hypothetical protein